MGQKSNYGGFGPTVHALSGMTHLTSFPGQPSIGPGFSYADHVAGLYASIKLLGALEERCQTGRGQHIDISEVDIMKPILPDNEKLRPVGNNSSLAAPHNVYLCQRDRWCAIAVFTEEEWRGLKKALGNPPWVDGKKFAALSSRLKHQDELDELITSWTRQRTAPEVMSLLQKSGVAAGVVEDAADLAHDPQLKDRGFFTKNTQTPLVDAVPIKMSAAKPEYKISAPLPGADNDYVYGKLLGISKKELSKLQENKVI
jgi:benzylsuccinate CoA-transferase BbsF subunit/naphthyl-2-methylsuccinate CoA transferase subunit